MPTHIILWYSTFTQIYTHWPDRNAVLASRQCLLHIIIRVNPHIPVVSILTFPMILQFWHVQYVCTNSLDARTPVPRQYTFLNHGKWNRCSCIQKKLCRAVLQCLTPAHKVFRQDDQEVHAISCFLSEADEMQYIGTPRVFPQVSLFFHLGKGARSSGWCVLHIRKWRHPCTLILILEFSFKFISIEKNWNGYRFANFLLK